MGSTGGASRQLVVLIRACQWWDRGIGGGWVTWVMEINLRGRESVKGRKRESYWAKGRENVKYFTEISSVKYFT